MSETRERTVAELMGWEVRNPHRWPGGHGDVESWKCAECGEWISTRLHPDEVSQCSSPWNQHPKPNPDDMLDWLDSRPTCYIEKIQRLDGMGWQVCLWRDPADYTYHYGPTLHAALEGAVRAVAEGGER